MLNDISLDRRVESLVTGIPEVDIAVLVIAFDSAWARFSMHERLLERTGHISASSDARQENNLRVCTLRHRLHRLKISDLHSRSRAQDISRFSHQLRALNLRACSNDLGFSDTFGLCGHGERVLELVAEDYVLDEHRFDLDTPASRDIFDDLADRLCDLLPAFNNILKNSRTHNMPQRRLRPFNQRLPHITNSERGLMRARNMIINHTRQLQCNIILRHADLLWHLDDLDLDIDLDEALGERVDLHETWVDGAVKTPEFGDEADVALGDGLVGIGTADAAGDGAESADAGAKTVDCNEDLVAV